MSVAKNIEITSTSKVSFDDAIQQGIKRASETIKDIKGSWIKEQKVSVSAGKITEYCVMMIVTFVLSEATAAPAKAVKKKKK